MFDPVHFVIRDKYCLYQYHEYCCVLAFFAHWFFSCSLHIDLNSDELIAKRNNAERIKQFSKNLTEYNKETLTNQRKLPSATEKQAIEISIKKSESKAYKAKEFSKNIPKPTVTNANANGDNGVNGGNNSGGKINNRNSNSNSNSNTSYDDNYNYNNNSNTSNNKNASKHHQHNNNNNNHYIQEYNSEDEMEMKLQEKLAKHAQDRAQVNNVRKIAGLK